ncbi:MULTISPECIES: MFS transporter [Calothrix]|uniref:MFS transporter n=2 Tax=Calothrix TaxID=1186 RepID=A0ABR8A627_9CYAN|nr:MULTISPECIES: MFS transporter [Calothrix]MBD2195455.1 MFS transporter [Calothrix parietina FACHB-288]MBD2223117.1 MFS transporter [Calothrix anomala FACHB-343]
MRIFSFIWLGQLFAMIGLWMTGFALDISVFKQTGSATQFAFLTISLTIPTILISPIAGTLVDLWDRRWTMIISHICTGLCTLTLIVLVSMGKLEIWQIYLNNILISIISTFHAPAYKASITSLVASEDLPRVSGMLQLGIGIQQIISPLIAGTMLEIVGIKGILSINLSTLLVAIITLLLVRFGEISQTVDVDRDAPAVSFWQKMVYGWTYLLERPGLSSFLILFTIYQFLVGFVSVLVYPLILCVSTPADLGKITFMSGIGMIVGGIAISSWKHNWQNLINPILIAMSLSGVWIALAGLRPSIIQMAIATLLFFLTSPFISASIQVIFQTKVAEHVQGRVFALIGAISGAAVPLAAIFAGPLADYVLEPLMAFNGPWSRQLVGQLIGSGPGRGIGLLFVIVGFFVFLAAIIAYQYPAIRQLGDNMPDYGQLPEPENQ